MFHWTPKLSLLFILWLLNRADCCSLPENITGNWFSADKGCLKISDTTIYDYPTTLFLTPYLNLTCLLQTGDRYLLKSDFPVDVFGQLTYFFLCLDMYKVKDDMFYYYLGNVATPFTNGEKIYGKGEDVPISEGCNRPEPFSTGSFIMLIRDGTVETGDLSTQCPDDMLAVFENVTIKNNAGNTENCPDTKLDVCTDRTKMNFTYDANCSSTTNIAKTYSDGGVYSCLHYVTDSGVTYLTVWNNDTSVDNSGTPPTYRITCLAFQKVGDVVYATEAPNYCSDSDQTTTTVGSTSGGNIISLSSITETCPDVESTTTTATITTTTTTITVPTVVAASMQYLYLLLLILLIPLIIIIAFLIKRCWMAKKNQKNARKSQESLVKTVIPVDFHIARADKNPPKMFKLHNYQPDDVKILDTVFKPKIPARVSPLFDPHWQPSKLPCLVPLAKVQPLYTDTTEDYLRSRLPRRPSHLSLYSFDSIIFSTEP